MTLRAHFGQFVKRAIELLSPLGFVNSKPTATFRGVAAGATVSTVEPLSSVHFTFICVTTPSGSPGATSLGTRYAHDQCAKRMSNGVHLPTTRGMIGWPSPR